MNHRRLLILLVLMSAFAPQLHAQVKVEIRIKRRFFVVYEPILVTADITNNSGRDLTLSDADSEKWFSFQVVDGEGRPVRPLDPNYHLNPLTIPAGQTVRRSLNLTSLYAVQELGTYRIKGSVYSTDYKQYFSSRSEELVVTEGKVVWEQTVGVPDGYPGAGSKRTLSLILFRMDKENVLYVRVQDKEGGVVYTTTPLGRLLTGYEPDALLDKDNQLHVLQLIGAKSYIYSRIGLNGEFLGQLTYNAVNSRPVLKKNSAGEAVVSGGSLDAPVSPTAPNAPKVSDRPPGFPQLQ